MRTIRRGYGLSNGKRRIGRPYDVRTVAAAWCVLMLMAWLASKTFGLGFDSWAALILTGILTAVGIAG